MSIEKITSKIENDAKKEADAVLDQAKKAAWEIVHEAEDKAKAIIAEAQARGTEDRDKQIQSRKAVAVIDGKNVTLAQKQKLIDQCFEEAMDKIHSMDKADYLEFLVRNVEDSGSRSGEIILSSEDSDIAQELLDALAARIEGSSFTLSEEKKDMTGGVVIKDGSRYFNGSLDTILAEVRESMTAELAEILFGGQEN